MNSFFSINIESNEELLSLQDNHNKIKCNDDVNNMNNGGSNHNDDNMSDNYSMISNATSTTITLYTIYELLAALDLPTNYHDYTTSSSSSYTNNEYNNSLGR